MVLSDGISADDKRIDASDKTSVKPNKETFPLEKILTISLRNFGSWQNLWGVHHDYIYDLGRTPADELTMIKPDFAAKVPKGAALVVDYKIFMVPVGTQGYVFVSQSGTAIMPRTK